MARPTSRIKSRRSQAVCDLRALLGDSQQAFSNRLGIALNTISRYETNRPPKGEALLKLAAFAGQLGHNQLRDFFRAEYLEDVHQEIGDTPLTQFATVDENQQKVNVAYLFSRLVGSTEVGLGQLFIQLIEGFRKGRSSQKTKDAAYGLAYYAAEMVYKKSILDQITPLYPDYAGRPPDKQESTKPTSTRKRRKV